jgi:hypothetical protein
VDYLESRLLDITNDGICPRRFDHKFPIPTAQRITIVDLRDIALTILLFSRLAKRNKNRKENYLYIASETLRWAIKNFYNDKNFFYEKTKFWMNRVPYISLQGWMVYALSEYFDAIESSNNSF